MSEQELDLFEASAGFPAELMEWSAAIFFSGYKGQHGKSIKLHTIGIDLGKTVFYLVSLNERGKVTIRKRCSRTQLLHLQPISRLI